jgi:flavin-binding protein dodecin
MGGRRGRTSGADPSLTEMVGSTESLHQAIRNGLAKASPTLRDLD